MLDEMGKNIDAVTVSIPDHNHAAALEIAAMRRGIHCYCQKPLTHSVSEARLMAQVARENKVATQMGNQGTANDSLRKAAAYIQSGALGKIKEVHVWTDRPSWPQGGPRPASTAVPQQRALGLVDWERPRTATIALGYHPFSWRGWWDFGTGSLGDMACHTFNMPFIGTRSEEPHNDRSRTRWSQQGQLSRMDGDQIPVPRYKFAPRHSGDVVRCGQEAQQ